MVLYQLIQKIEAKAGSHADVVIGITLFGSAAGYFFGYTFVLIAYLYYIYTNSSRSVNGHVTIKTPLAPSLAILSFLVSLIALMVWLAHRSVSIENDGYSDIYRTFFSKSKSDFM